MRDRGEKNQTGDVGIVLGMLSAIERDSSVTQRDLARELRIALGLTNAYLKRCAKKGFIKVRQVPLNRYAYYITPRGFAEKSRLTAEYLSASLDFFRRARHDCQSLFNLCQARGWRRAALVGTGELAEIAVLSAGETDIEIVCVIDDLRDRISCAGRPLAADFARAIELCGGAGLDVVIVTDAAAPQQRFERALAEAARFGLAADRVMALDLLRVAVPTAKGRRYS